MSPSASNPDSRVKQIEQHLLDIACPDRANITKSFFKTGTGEYSNTDLFIGIRVPTLRNIAQQHTSLSLHEVESLLHSPVHEQRLCALFIWVYQYKKRTTSTEDKQSIYDAYIRNSIYVNNWDLVDTTTPHIVGEHLFDRDRSLLDKWSLDNNLWKRRMSIVATWAFIRRKDLDDTFRRAEVLLDDSEDLMHKAVGWMLREAGKRDQNRLTEFLEKHKSNMPRTMLRYSIEKFDPQTRKYFLRTSKP